MNGLLHLALNASFLVQLVMITLIGLSVWSWVIIFVKKKELKDIYENTVKYSGNLGSSGSVSYLFNKIGVISFNDTLKSEEIADLAIENNAIDIINDDNYVEIHTDKADFLNITKVLKESGFSFDNAELEMHAETKVELDDEAAENFLKFIDSLEEVDDVQNVYTNAKYPEGDN